jgi:biotin operon repressor
MKKEFSTFSVIPTDVMINKEISSTAKVLYGIISSLTNEKGYCWASNKYLGELIGISERQVSTTVNDLSEIGLIVSDVDKNYKRKITLTMKMVGRKKTSRGVEENCVGGRRKLPHNNIKEQDKDNIYIADKSANDKLSEDKPNKLTDLYKQFGLPEKVKIAPNKWQDEAANAIKYFQDIQGKESSVFKCFKDNEQKARLALSDCKELGKNSIYYFLKVYNELKKK